MARAPKPQLEWDQLFASTDFRELFRYAKAGTLRVYNLRVEPDGASVWVKEETNGSIRTVDRKKFKAPDEAREWLSFEERQLATTGWKEIETR